MAIVLQSEVDTSIDTWTDKERDLVHKLRAMLKDIPENRNYRSLNTLVEKEWNEYRWSDELLLTYIQIAMSDINATPPLTVYTIYDVPVSWDGLVLTGAFIMALMGEAVLQTGMTFSYSDNGLSLSIDQAGKYQSIAGALLSAYDNNKTNLKKTIRPYARGIKGQVPSVHLRSYSPKMWIWR